MFAPFQRLGDTSGAGLGLGLAVADGLRDAPSAAELSRRGHPRGGLTDGGDRARSADDGPARWQATGSSSSTTSPGSRTPSPSPCARTAGRSRPPPTAPSAIEAAASPAPDVVLLDLGLPDMSGLDVITALRGWSRVPIVVLSARQHGEDKVDALDAGADDYVTKPFAMNELLARLRAAVRRASTAVDTDEAVVRRRVAHRRPGARAACCATASRCG